MLVFILYIALCITAKIICDKSGRDKKRSFLIVTGIASVIVMGFRRYSVGTDTASYCAEFLQTSYLSWEQVISKGTNFGFFVFVKVISLIAPNNPTLYLIVVAVIIEISVSRFLYKYSDDVLFSRILLLSLGFNFFFMTGIKQTLALAVLLYTYDSLEEKKFLKFVILTLIAALFHNTALVFILAWPLTRLRLKKGYLISGVLAISLTYVYANQISAFFRMVAAISDKYYFYGTIYRSNNNYTGLIIQATIFITSMLFILTKKNKIEQTDQEVRSQLTIYIIAMFFQTLTPIVAEFFRISLYFSIYGATLLPNGINRSRIRNKLLIKTAIMVVLITYFLFFSINESGILPYEFCF